MPTEIDILCNFPHGQEQFTFKIGAPNPERHPLFFQEKWLKEFKNGVIPAELINSLKKLYDLAKENNANFEELAAYAMKLHSKEATTSTGFKNFNLTKHADEFFKANNSNAGIISNDTQNSLPNELNTNNITKNNVTVENKTKINDNDKDLLLQDAKDKTEEVLLQKDVKDQKNPNNIYGNDDDLL